MEAMELLDSDSDTLHSSYTMRTFTEHDDLIVSYLDNAWGATNEWYSDIDSVTSLVLNFYNGNIPDEYRRVYNQATGEMEEVHNSTSRIGWTKRAITQIADEITTGLFSNNDFFDIQPTLGSENATAVCRKIVLALLHNAGFEAFMEETIRTYLLFGETGVYVHWVDDESVCLHLERIPYKRIRHLPAHVPPSKAVLSYVQSMTKYDLLDTPDTMFYNVDALEEPEGTSTPIGTEGINETVGSKNGKVRVVTSYIPEMVIDGVVYRNTVAVIADQKHLLQFNTGLSPEEFMSRPHIRAVRENYVHAKWGPLSVGQSIAHQAIDIELSGFVVQNLMLDCAKLTVHPPRGYDVTDTALKAFIAQQGAASFAPAKLVPLSDIQNPNSRNLKPLFNDSDLLQKGMAVLQRLEQQYLMTIGIPDFGGGVASDDQRVAATTRTIQASRAALRMKALVKDVNRQLILPIVHQVYRLVSAAYNEGKVAELANAVAPVEFALATQNQEIAPALYAERFKMAVYESPTARGERINAMQQLMSALPQVLQSYPTLMQEAGIEIPRMFRQYMQDLGIPASMPVAPSQLQQPPMAQGDPYADPAMEGQPADPETLGAFTDGSQPLEGIPDGLPFPSSL